MKNRTLIYDVLLIISVLLLSFFMGFVPMFFSSEGKSFVLSCPEMTAEYSLSENREIYLDYATVIVEDGTVRVENSDCRDKTCEKFGKISNAGESIICIPNRLRIRISGKSEVDAVAE